MDVVVSGKSNWRDSKGLATGPPCSPRINNTQVKDWGFLAHSRYLLHDCDGKFCPVFREVIQAGKVKPLKFPGAQLNLNAFAELWVVDERGMSRTIILTERRQVRSICLETGFSSHPVPTIKALCRALSFRLSI